MVYAARACFQLPQWPGGSDLWRARNPKSRRWFLWGLHSYCAASTPPAQQRPSLIAPFKGLSLVMVCVEPAFSCRNRRWAPICGGRINSSQDEGFLWGLGSHSAHPRPPAPQLKCAV